MWDGDRVAWLWCFCSLSMRPRLSHRSRSLHFILIRWYEVNISMYRSAARHPYASPRNECIWVSGPLAWPIPSIIVSSWFAMTKPYAEGPGSLCEASLTTKSVVLVSKVAMREVWSAFVMRSKSLRSHSGLSLTKSLKVEGMRGSVGCWVLCIGFGTSMCVFNHLGLVVAGVVLCGSVVIL